MRENIKQRCACVCGERRRNGRRVFNARKIVVGWFCFGSHELIRNLMWPLLNAPTTTTTTTHTAKPKKTPKGKEKHEKKK
jgi:hypothetical protein